MTDFVFGNGRRRGTPHIPTEGSPLVVKLYSLIKEQGATLTALDRKSGVSRSTIRNWRKRPPEAWANLEAVLNVLGHELVIRKCE